MINPTIPLNRVKKVLLRAPAEAAGVFLTVWLALTSPALAYLFASGSYTGDATNDRVIDISDTTSPSVEDFQPDVVWVKCDVDAVYGVWKVAAMGTNNSLRLIGGALTTTAIRNFVSNGFTVGVDDANVSAATCYYIALKNGTENDVATGSYLGNGQTTQTITTTPGFLPLFAFVQGGNVSWGQWRVGANNANQSCIWNVGSAGQACALTTRIRSFISTGFTVGNAASVNSSGVTYYYWTLRTVTGAAASGVYTGTGADGLQITTVGFQPKFLLIRAATTDTGTCYRFQAQSGDLTFPYDDEVAAANRIQSFLSNGFEVGTSTCANVAASDFVWFALSESTNVVRRRPSVIPY